jgi:hypothetical protein
MKYKNGIIVVVVLLVGMLAVATGCGNSAAQTRSNNTSPTATLIPNTSLTTTPSASPTPTDLAGIISITSLSVNGLKLSLSLNSTTLQSGQKVTIVIDEQNTLSVENNILSSRNWPLNGLSLGPCGTLNYPFGVAILQGYYSSANVATATPLILYDPGAIYHCPMILSEITAYVFQPSSDTAAIFGSCGPNPCFTTKINAEVRATGYWTGSPTATLTNFTPGVYTVVTGDEWGISAVLHFVVSG